MRSRDASILRSAALFLLVLPANLLGNDIDADGVQDAVDVCSNTPPGITVDGEGRPLADLDDDCDVDLSDFGVLQINFTGLDDAALLQANLTGPLPCVAGIPDKDIQLRHVLRDQASGNTTACRLPTSEADYLQGSCFLMEIYAVDTREEPAGISCVFFDVDLGDTDCPLAGTGIVVSDTFPDFQSGSFVSPGWADEVGGCTLDAGVGVGEWVLIATIDVVAPQAACCTAVSLEEAETDSSLVGGGITAELGFGASSDVNILCPGVIYDLWPSGGNGFIDAGDRSVLIPCIGETAPFSEECSQTDWNCDGLINDNDKAFFDTAWQKGICAGGIEIPACQLNCDGMTRGTLELGRRGVSSEHNASP